jgi:catechol 2,3-dioxygenase-like lactoylglutathione lyase family enzyme
MKQHLSAVTLVVKDYDEALDFYLNKLNFQLIEDLKMSDTKRWVLIRPPGENQCCLLLGKAANDAQLKALGNQTGGRVFLFLHTDNFDRDYALLLKNKVTIIREPKVENYGKVAVFSDLYGNLIDLIEPVD